MVGAMDGQEEGYNDACSEMEGFVEGIAVAPQGSEHDPISFLHIPGSQSQLHVFVFHSPLSHPPSGSGSVHCDGFEDGILEGIRLTEGFNDG
mmetsp:Transcript_32124/g.65593  ORF Transcript_32124/g.65593 Transcript_32124/m.65593 type:complete len:92 (-) Transcript_32124:8-283(-)